jgi:hypothetical protein
VEVNRPIQFFPVKNLYSEKIGIQVVELKITSNNGNKEFTCLYKFRVHGKLLNKLNDKTKTIENEQQQKHLTVNDKNGELH